MLETMRAADLAKRWLFPPLRRRALLRMVLVAGGAWLVFGHVLLPVRIHGRSMEPTYRDGGFNLVCLLRYRRSPPQRGDVVAVRLAGRRVLLLKRVVALPGETVAFREGRLLVNGRPLPEPYVRFRGSWNLPPRRVRPGHYYLVGDNRSGPMEAHVFGQAPAERIVGGPLW
ncbi:signal peptidase I [Dissulfurirhabdus thermomarina]|uniref:Signal peptidase I n=1 Tax=Dissulfurirhabdus thermomarina TaxID=1765737 RepID=A0A6N9TMU0_DISTH|nr:signal peptidase I [Dissulfurirhabdus thermomarina]NDY42449.1 signal peptidase I [Dissulfurirhabdus thermomarina]NMX23385.1 signal peptidase I [Dissulfurirhabdus thermomarina]